MDDYVPDVKLIKSYVWHDGKCYFVSTIDRDSSAMQGGRFSETMVWNYDWNTHKRDDGVLYQDGGPENFIGRHLKLCQRIFDTGTFEDEEK